MAAIMLIRRLVLSACLLVAFSVRSQAFQSPLSLSKSELYLTRASSKPCARYSSLFSSPSPLEDDSSSSKRNQSNRNPLGLLVRVVTRLSSSVTRATTRFSALSRRAKAVVLVQLLLLFTIFGGITRSAQRSKAVSPVELPYSQFMDLVEGSSRASGTSSDRELHILDLKIGTDRIGFQIARGNTPEQRKALKEYKLGMSPSVPIPSRSAYTRKVSASPELINYLRHNHVPFRAASAVTNASMVAISLRVFLFTLYILYMWRIMKAMTGGGTSSPGKLANVSELPLARFDEIQGIDDAKFEVMELVDTLRNPDKYAILGARAPKGLLLEGPPGTGKTLLARATAATAGVPLLYCSGSDFVEMFVGRGAARVRRTFEKAQKLAPCLIFIDELDALGKSRDTGVMANLRSNDEAEQTLNQLLACMDGLDSKASQICVMAATNRREVLDPALLRPGRFDRIVRLQLPDSKGREAILRVHARKLPGFKECSGVDPNKGGFGIGDAVDLSTVALATPGCSGAELEFIVNEAAIRAVRRVSAALRDAHVDKSRITPNVKPEDFESAVRSFYETRKKNGGNSMSDIISSVWK